MAESSAITAQEAATALSGLRTVRDTVNFRAAGLSWMMWALVITSMAGSLVSYAMIRFQMEEAGKFANSTWALFMISLFAIVAFWAALGAVVQGLIWRSFTTPAGPGGNVWKAPLTAFATAFASIVLNMFLQGVTRDLQGIGTTPDQYDDLHHNLGFATALFLGGATFVAITLVQGQGGLPRRTGLAIGFGAMALGHLGTFLWVPDLGWSGVVVAALALPFGLVAYGLHLWRQG